MLKSGRAKVICRKPFTIQLLYETTEYTQKLILGIDPGGKDIGWAVRKANGELVEAGHMQTRSAEGEREYERTANAPAKPASTSPAKKTASGEKRTQSIPAQAIFAIPWWRK